MKPTLCLGLLLAGLAGTMPAYAQGTQLTDADYARAAKFLIQSTDPLVGNNADPLVYHSVKHVTWIDSSHFWYRDHSASGDHFLEMNAATGKLTRPFNQAKLGKALGKVLGKTVDAKHWPKDFSFHPTNKGKHDNKFDVRLGFKQYTCDLSGAGTCKPNNRGMGKMGLSPDGKLQAFTRDHNVWVRNLASGKETQVTFDGFKDDDYGSGGYTMVKWSPNSKLLVAFRQDSRGIKNMYTVRTRVGHAELETWPYPLPGDKRVFMVTPVVVNVAQDKEIPLQMAPEQQLGPWMDIQWSPDSRTFALMSTSRNHQHIQLRIADAATGDVRTAIAYHAKDYYQGSYGGPDWYYLAKRHQAVFPTEQNNWMNLYLYDTRTGQQLRPITTGAGDVIQVLKFDKKTHTLWYVGTGRTPGINPYYTQLFKVDIDTGKTTLLTPGDYNHIVTLSPDGKYFVDAYSTSTTPTVTVLRSAENGHQIATVAKTDISHLVADGWVPPVPFTVKARDGKTDLYGLLYKPSNFDPHEKYPVIDFIYPGPQIGSIATFGFRAIRGGHQALAELGFIVVTVDGLGTPYRSASFQREWYGDMGDDTLPDQITTIKQLAARHPWMNLDKVGIWGHSGGGNATVSAMLHYPKFFKVGWAESGNYDNRDYSYTWGEKWEGLLTHGKNGTTNYDNQASELIAKNLSGPLMLVTGAIDNNVPPSNTYLMVNALMNANKNFQMLVVPNQRHHYGKHTPYVTRRMWDWFVTKLAGNIPPHEFGGMPTTLTQ
ncbi:MAG TPA: DPP IV N-terminal domain-containing protein [Rhodanobacteraceae bacterium]